MTPYLHHQHCHRHHCPPPPHYHFRHCYYVQVNSGYEASGQTPLHIAASDGSINAIASLVAAGAGLEVHIFNFHDRFLALSAYQSVTFVWILTRTNSRIYSYEHF